MPDPIHHLAQVTYSAEQMTQKIKDKVAEWGHSISTQLSKHSPQLMKKMQGLANKRLSSNPAPVKQVNTPKASATPSVKQQKESSKMAKKAIQFFDNLKTKFNKSYEAIKTKDEVSKEAKALLNGSKKFTELDAKEQGIIKLYFSACTPKEAENIFKSLVKSNNPSTLAIFQSVISTDREKILNHLLKSKGFSQEFVNHVKAQVVESGPQEVFAFLNSSPSVLSQLTANALLTSEASMTIPGTDHQISIKEYTKESLVNLCQGDQATIAQNRNFLLNIPSNHLQETLGEVWNNNPADALKTIATLQPFAKEGDISGTEVGIRDFLEEKLRSSEAKQSFLHEISAFHPDDAQGMAAVLSAVPPLMSEGIFKQIIEDKSYKQDFLVQVANQFISSQIRNADHPSEILANNNVTTRFILALQKELISPMFDSEATEYVLWGQVPTQQFKTTNAETKETNVSAESKANYQSGMKGVFSHLDSLTLNSPPPAPLKMMYQHLNNEMNARFPSDDNMHGKNAVMNLFILRAVNPLLLNPTSSTPYSGNQSQNAIEMAKGLQKFANGERFTEAESYLDFINPFFDTKAEFRSQLFNRLTQP